MKKVTPGVRKQILKIIFRYVPKEECAAFLFGSLAQAEIYPSSDIDVGLVCNKPLKNSTLVKIKEELLERAKTLRDIDIVDFSAVRDREFLRIALQDIRIWHQTRKSKAYLGSLKKRITD